MQYLISSLIGYLLGSIPSAYLIVKKSSGKNILETGSGNAGAYNSYEVSNSKIIGLMVLIADAVKGVLSVIIVIFIYPNDFTSAGLSLLFSVFSHCYNPWLGLRGGRGLATAAGGVAIIIPYLLIVWAILWVIFYVIKKDIHLGNIAATVMSLLIFFNTYEIALKYTNPVPENSSSMIILATAVLMIIFIKHIDPLKELISKFKSKGSL